MDFLRFLETAMLDGVGPDSTVDDVLRELGPPDDTSVPGLPMINKYGNVQITFDHGIVAAITVALDESAPAWHAALRPAGAAPRSAASMDEVRAILEAQGIEYSNDTQLTFDDQTTWRLAGAGVRALFLADRLSRIYWARSHRATPRRS